MAQFEDTFTDDSDVDLSQHTPDTGTAWTRTGDNEALRIDSTDNAVTGGGGSAAEAYYLSDDLGAADHYTAFKVSPNDINADIRLSFFGCVRLTDKNNFIGHNWYGDGSLGSRVYKYDGGNGTALIEEDAANLNDQWVKVEADGDTIGLYHGGTGATPSWTLIAEVTESFNNTETRQGFVRISGVSGRNVAYSYLASTLGGGGTTDNAVITSASATPLASTDTSTATDNATLTAAVASVIASTDTTQSTDSAQTTSVSASVLSSTDTSAATDTASLTSASAAVLTATAQSIASDAAAIVTAAATPLTSTETTGGSGSTETDSALITGAAASPLTGTESAQSTDTAAITAVGAATLTATEAAVSTDGATITPASVTIQTSTETASALDSAVIVNAQGQPLASIESVRTDANITTVTVTPLTSAESTGTAEILLGTPEIAPKLSAEPNTVPVLKASPAVVAKLKANIKVTPE